MSRDSLPQEQIELLEELLHERGDSLSPRDSDALFARISAELDAEMAPKQEERPKLRLLPFRGAGAAVTVFAAAAAFALVYIGRGGGELVDAAPRGSEIVAIDFGSNAGTHFSVEGEEGQMLAVVWIDDGDF